MYSSMSFTHPAPVCTAELPGTGVVTFWQESSDWLRETSQQWGGELSMRFGVMSRWAARNSMDETMVAWREDFCPVRGQWHLCLLPSLILSLDLRLHLSTFWKCRNSQVTPPSLWGHSPCFPLPSEGYTSDYETKWLWPLKWEINGWAGLNSLQKYLQTHQEHCINFFHSGQKAKSQHVLFDSYIKVFIRTLGLPALTLCCVLGSSPVEVRGIFWEKCF